MTADGTSPGPPENLNNHYLWRMLFDTQQIVGSAFRNSEFVGSQAELFARRVFKEAPPSSPVDVDTVPHAFRMALFRKPTTSERQMLLAFLEE